MLLYIPYPSWLKPEIIPGLPVRWYGLMYLIISPLWSRTAPKGKSNRTRIETRNHPNTKPGRTDSERKIQ